MNDTVSLEEEEEPKSNSQSPQFFRKRHTSRERPRRLPSAHRGFLARVASAVEPDTAPPLAGSNKAHYRLVVMGAAKVGKTSIIKRFLYEQFPDDYSATVEELHRGEFEIGGAVCTLDILDTSGSFEFPAMRHLAINTGDAFVLVYCVDSTDSFEEVRRLRQLTLDMRPAGVPIVVVGNKCDISKRAVGRELAETMTCIDWELSYVECSAKSGSNIVEIFKLLMLQANLKNCLTPNVASAVRPRRRSLPVTPMIPCSKVNMRKRNSCAMS